MTSGLYHLQRRKRIHIKHEPYPHPDKWKRFVDKAIYFGGIIGPVVALPQASKIWIEKNVEGVAVITWMAFLVAALFWLTYGIAHKEKPIIFVYGVWAIIDFVIIIGIFLNS